MSTKIFVNLPVKDLKRSIEFFSKLGYEFNPQFTGETAASMVISEDIYAMLLTEPHFKGFTPKEIVDAKRSTEVIVALSLESREQVTTSDVDIATDPPRLQCSGRVEVLLF